MEVFFEKRGGSWNMNELILTYRREKTKQSEPPRFMALLRF